jgi:hypothetical protein
MDDYSAARLQILLVIDELRVDDHVGHAEQIHVALNWIDLERDAMLRSQKDQAAELARYRRKWLAAQEEAGT